MTFLFCYLWATVFWTFFMIKAQIKLNPAKEAVMLIIVAALLWPIALSYFTIRYLRLLEKKGTDAL